MGIAVRSYTNIVAKTPDNAFTVIARWDIPDNASFTCVFYITGRRPATGDVLFTTFRCVVSRTTGFATTSSTDSIVCSVAGSSLWLVQILGSGYELLLRVVGDSTPDNVHWAAEGWILELNERIF